MIDIDLVDFGGIDVGHAETLRAAANLRCQILAPGGCQPFGVVDPLDALAGAKDDRSGHDRAGERSDTGFVDTGDSEVLGAPELALAPQELPESLLCAPRFLRWFHRAANPSARSSVAATEPDGRPPLEAEFTSANGRDDV